VAGVLSAEQRAEFDRTGILELRGAFATQAAERMADVVWNELARRYEIERGDPTTWDRHEPTGLKSSKKSHAFDAIMSPVVVAALDDLFGVERWQPPKTMGNVLVTMPNTDEWRVPHKVWHSDFDAGYGVERLFAVKLWAIVNEVRPHGGGTPQLLGSHHLFARYLAGTDERDFRTLRLGLMKTHPWLKALVHDDGDPARNTRFMDREVDIDGLPARVVELTGDPGDVFITHPWVFHSIAANALDQPRIMRSTAVFARS
jgi:hypothetical protein